MGGGGGGAGGGFGGGEGGGGGGGGVSIRTAGGRRGVLAGLRRGLDAAKAVAS